MKGGIGQLMKQAQEMQANMQKAQEELANAEVTGEAGAGMVSVVMTGRHDVKRVSIDDAVLGEDKEVLEDLLAAAVAPLVELETSDRINPNDDPRAFDWEQATGGQDTLIVGHLPFVARLASLLVVENPDRPMTSYRPGSVVCLERDSDGHWQINWMIRPHLLG